MLVILLISTMCVLRLGLGHDQDQKKTYLGRQLGHNEHSINMPGDKNGALRAQILDWTFVENHPPTQPFVRRVEVWLPPVQPMP